MSKQKKLSGLPYELLNLVTVGAATLAGATPDETWGKHTQPKRTCKTCKAWKWFDASQEELGRREDQLGEPV